MVAQDVARAVSEASAPGHGGHQGVQLVTGYRGAAATSQQQKVSGSRGWSNEDRTTFQRKGPRDALPSSPNQGNFGTKTLRTGGQT